MVLEQLVRSGESNNPPGFFPASLNRREHPRESLVVEIGLLAQQQFYTGFTQDISAGGLFLATTQLLPIGERIRVLFRLPQRDNDFQPLCEVRWHRTPRSSGDPAVTTGMGLRFVDLTPEEEHAINQFICGEDTMFYPDDEFDTV
jgi:uncharacterized protein (TIGR02266 family)